MKKKLLLADDSITIQKVIAITFSSDDYALTVVDNGDVALEKARSEKPDLVLADVFMPGKNGYELCAAIKQDPLLSGVPVLLLTGTFEPFDEAKARAVGAETWIAKPFESQALIDCVEGLLAKAAKGTSARPVAAPPVAASAPRPVAPVVPVVASQSSPQPVVAPSAPVRAPVPPVVSPAGADDLWGDAGSLKDDFSEFGGASGDGDSFAAADAAGDDLWGAVSLEELSVPGVAALPPLEEDVWGAIEEELPAVAGSGAAQAAPGEQDLWGGFEADALTQSESVTGATASAWGDDEALAMDEVEILEEEDLSLDIDPPLHETTFSAGAAPAMELELAGFDAEPNGISLDWDEPATAVAAPSVKQVPGVQLPQLEAEFATAAQAAVSPQPVRARPEVAIEAQVAALSEADLERIIEKIAGAVIERLVGSVLEKIAWDVVPDLAESLIRDEIQKIKEAV